MSPLARLAALVVFALAYVSQPLALDACAASCEAARAARAPAVAAPCHHTTSCASQISQPTAPGSAAVKLQLAPAVMAVALDTPLASILITPARSFRLVSSSPPSFPPLRI